MGVSGRCQTRRQGRGVITRRESERSLIVCVMQWSVQQWSLAISHAKATPRRRWLTDSGVEWSVQECTGVNDDLAVRRRLRSENPCLLHTVTRKLGWEGLPVVLHPNPKNPSSLALGRIHPPVDGRNKIRLNLDLTCLFLVRGPTSSVHIIKKPESGEHAQVRKIGDRIPIKRVKIDRPSFLLLKKKTLCFLCENDRQKKPYS